MDHPTSTPTVSVVMPVRNEVDNIGAALDAVLDQDYDGPLEVIVADGRSTDGTADLVRTRAADDERIHLVDNPAGSAAAGLNVAIAAASGSIIVRCDGHARLGAGYIETAVATLAEQFPAPHQFDVVDVADAESVDAWAGRVLQVAGAPDALAELDSE